MARRLANAYALLLLCFLAHCPHCLPSDGGRPGRETLAIAEYVRGPEYKFFLNEEQREKGMGYLGSRGRLKAALQKALDGKHIHVTTVGGSVTAGLHGAGDGHSWPDYFFNFLNDTFPGQVVTSNGAVPGTISSYMSACVNVHVPRTTDIVLVEYSVNDIYQTRPLFDNEYRRAYERLLRKLLSYPNSPAVILMHSYNWMSPPVGHFFNSIEREYVEYAYFYDLPSLSLKSACFEAMRAGEEGFSVEHPRHDDQDKLAGKAFFWDRIHPDTLTGNRAMAELAMHLILKVRQELQAQGGQHGRQMSDTTPVLPEPMVKGNYASLADRCFIGHGFQATVVLTKGFEWLNDSKTKAPKFGYISKVPGSILQIKVNTLASSSAGSSKEDGRRRLNPDDLSNLILVQLVHLKSYEGMGSASLACKSGCKCEDSTIEGLSSVHNSQLYLHSAYVTQHEDCLLEIVVNQASKGSAKVKIAGVIVSEETGEMKGAAKTADSVELVTTTSLRGGGSFDVRKKPKNPGGL